ncbi:hypothetical protein BJX99DRAFT_257600 [Aspergillus californicus]
MKFSTIPNPLGGFQDICRLTCCTALINSALSPHLVFPSAPQFPSLVNAHYATSAPLQPACFVQPQTSDQVALAVSILVETDDGTPECNFAIRSGGHMPYKGAAGAEGGVTIDLAMLNATVYHPESSTVSIMGGARWGEVYKTLKPYGIAVTGGRSDTVGVGGLMIGGGLSYFAPKYGFACDNVVSFEIVLSNGKLTTASSTSNPELFKALKGGGNNFGIVTKVELRTFTQGPLWGGLLGHELSAIPAQINALVHLTTNLTSDPHANCVAFWQYSGNSNTSIAVSGLQYALGVDSAPILHEFLGIPQTFSTLRTTDIYDLMMESAPPPGKRALFLTLTFRNDARVLEHLHSLHGQAVHTATATMMEGENNEDKNWDIISFLQPFPSFLGKVTKESHDKNVLGLEDMDGDHILYLFFLSWTHPASDHIFHSIGYDLIKKLKTYTQETSTDSDYIYMNYAGRDQNPLRGYGEENLEYLAAVARKYDPLGVFQRQVPGGFKITKA